MHKILIVPGRHAARGQLFSGYMGERLLVDRTYDPEHAACRVLAAEGLSGLVETYWPGKPYACMRLDIQRAAKRAVSSLDIKQREFVPYNRARQAVE